MDAMSLRRRQLLSRLGPLLTLAGLAGCSGWPGTPRSLQVSTAELERKLRERMPLRQSLAGLLDLNATLQGLRMLPEQDRIAAEMSFSTSGPLLGQAWQGSMELLFGLRYEPTDHSLRAHQLALNSLQLPGLSGRRAELLQTALGTLSRQLADEVVLHRLAPRDLDRLQDLGLRPGAVTVTPQGLELGLVPIA